VQLSVTQSGWLGSVWQTPGQAGFDMYSVVVSTEPSWLGALEDALKEAGDGTPLDVEDGGPGVGPRASSGQPDC
jgi:hypothetical protein